MQAALTTRVVLVTFTVAWMSATSQAAAAPSLASALRLAPLQKADVACDYPEGDALKDLSVEPVKEDSAAGWKVIGKDGRLYRRFVDTNGDNKLDQWCYYKDGVEIYRDIDGDFNGKADQYRWMGAAGIRWGLDSNEDGEIDRWKVISPEEVSAEVVAAIRDGDKQRFARLLLTSGEVGELGMDEQRQTLVMKKLSDADDRFATAVRKNRDLADNAEWVHFGGSLPSVACAGVDGLTKDLYVYNNVGAVIRRGEKHSQIMIGTLVRVGDAWRLMDVPESLGGGAETSQILSAGMRREPIVDDSADGMDAATRELATALSKIDTQLASASARERSALHARRAQTLRQLIERSKGADRETWVRQFADLISAAAQSGDYNAGLKQLNSLIEQLKDERAEKGLLAYVTFRTMSAEYAMEITQPEADFAKIQEAWLKKLDQFVAAYPKSDDAAEATLQLAIAREFAGEDQQAITLYGRITRDYPQSPVAAKAAGAKRRLQSPGKSIAIEGPTLDGGTASLAQLRGKTVLVHYWATWCEPCKKDMQLLKSLQAKYARRGFAVLGVNLDSSKDDAVTFLRSNSLPWPHLYEPGGLDSRLANELGVPSLPTMLLIDSRGRVVNRGIHSRELEDELAKLMRN